jgi:hypothetical protein
LEIEALAGTVAIDVANQDLSGSAISGFTRPFDRIDARTGCAAIDAHLGTAESRTDIDRYHNTLPAEAPSRLADQIRAPNGRRPPASGRDCCRAPRVLLQ